MPELHFITVACNCAEELAAFWAAALDGQRRDLPPSIDDVVVDLPKSGPDLLFKSDLSKGTQRDLPIHLDLEAESRETAVEELQALGAIVRETKAETFETHTSTWTVMEDPEGNGFCVTEYSE